MKLFSGLKFKDFLSNRTIAKMSVYGSTYSLCVPLEEVKENGFSSEIAKLLNEDKAVQIDNNVYIDPYYDSYTEKWEITKKKLLARVRQDNFRALLNQSTIIISGDFDEKESYVYKLSQQDIRRCNAVMTIAELINKGYAYMDDDENIYLKLYFLERLETKKAIQSDLSRFRTMLGESDNLRQLISLIEDCKFDNKQLCIEFKELDKYQLKTEIFSLIDLGIAKSDGKKVYIEPEFASWLLACVGNTSDRISFVNMYEE